MRFLRDIFKDAPLEDESAAVEEIARRVVREGMGAAAIMFLESSKPVSFLAGEAAIVATPVLGVFVDPRRIERYADLLSRRDFIERLIARIEDLENEAAGKPKAKGESEAS